MKNTTITEFTTDDFCEGKADSNKLTFSCPKCGGGSLQRIETGMVDCDSFTHIFSNGDIEWQRGWMSYKWLQNLGIYILGVIMSLGYRLKCKFCNHFYEAIHFECSDCGYVIVHENGDIVSDEMELVEWLMLNCDQASAEASAGKDCPSMTETSPSKPDQLEFNPPPEARHDKPWVERPERQKVGFTCPECGNNWLHQLQTGVWDCTVVESVYDDGTIEIGNWEYDYDGAEVSYQCGKCGYLIKDENGRLIDGDEDLAKWLIQRERAQHWV